MFRRKGKRSSEDDEAAAPVEEEVVEEAAPAPTPAASAPRTGGPWDSDDDVPAEPPRVDLGGLRIPVMGGLELRVDVNEQGTIVAATLVHGPSAMQLNAFAAPRHDGIWSEVADEIAASLAGSGGMAERADGPFGLELRARVPAQSSPGAAPVLQPARFVGIDGPRWFLRGLITGPAALEPADAELLEAALREVVVVRGTEAMAPRDALTLRLPQDLEAEAEAAAAQAQEAAEEERRRGLPPPERGPEITEVR